MSVLRRLRKVRGDIRRRKANLQHGDRATEPKSEQEK